MTEDSTDKIRDANESGEELRSVLESNVEDLQRAVNEIESTIDEADLEISQEKARTKEVQGQPLDGEPSEVEVSELIRMGESTRLVLSDFETALSLLEQDQIGVEGDMDIILTSEIARQLSDRFPINSYFQKLQERENIEIRQEPAHGSRLSEIYLTEDRVYYPVRFGSVKRYVRLSSSDIYQQLSAEFNSLFSSADDLDLDVPPWKDLLDGLADATSEESAREFETLVEAATPDDLDSLDEVSLALIAAARTGALQYDISKWGEEMNIASKATFSRRKSSLVDDGVITTESVPVEVGRPRERLLISGDSSGSSEVDTPKLSNTTEKSRSRDRQEDDAELESELESNTAPESDNLDDVLDEMLKEIVTEDS